MIQIHFKQKSIGFFVIVLLEYYLPKRLELLNTFKLTLGIEFSVQDLTALAVEVGTLKASGCMESISSVLSQIILASEVFRT